MACNREDQPSLFDKEVPRVALEPVQMTELAKVLAVLLGEIAAALAGMKTEESRDE